MTSKPEQRPAMHRTIEQRPAMHRTIEQPEESKLSKSTIPPRKLSPAEKVREKSLTHLK